MWQVQTPAYLLVEATSSHTLQNVNREVVQRRFVVKLREQLTQRSAELLVWVV